MPVPDWKAQQLLAEHICFLGRNLPSAPCRHPGAEAEVQPILHLSVRKDWLLGGGRRLNVIHSPADSPNKTCSNLPVNCGLQGAKGQRVYAGPKFWSNTCRHTSQEHIFQVKPDHLSWLQLLCASPTTCHDSGLVNSFSAPHKGKATETCLHPQGRCLQCVAGQTPKAAPNKPG